METDRRKLTHALRRLLASPAFTFATVTTLALAVGANAAIFTLVDRVVLSPLAYRTPTRSSISITRPRPSTRRGASR